LLLFALAPIALFAFNVVRGDIGMPAMFLGYRMELGAAQRSFVWIVDRVRDDGSLTQVLFPSRTTEDDYDANVRRLRAAGRTHVWVTPKIPFMLPLLLGFVTAFFLGDVLFTLVRTIVERVRA